MLLLGRKTAREKIASLLAIMARREAVMGKVPATNSVMIDLPLTREAMATYLGLTLETVSRQMSALKAVGIIELVGRRQVRVPDLRRLQQETGDDAGPVRLVAG